MITNNNNNKFIAHLGPQVSVCCTQGVDCLSHKCTQNTILLMVKLQGLVKASKPGQSCSSIYVAGGLPHTSIPSASSSQSSPMEPISFPLRPAPTPAGPVACICSGLGVTR